MKRSRENYQKNLDEQWKSKINSLSLFIEQHKRLPSQIIKEENHEYQFLNLQRHRLKNNLLLEERIIPFKAFLHKYQQYFAQKRNRLWNSRLKSIEEFIEKHNRLPSRSIKEEITNSKFLWKQKINLKNNLLSPPQAELLTNFFNKHMHYFMDRWQKGWKSKINSLSLFIEQHKRLPSWQIKEELSHYQFLHLQKHRLKNNTLPQERILPFKEFLHKFQHHFK